MLGEDLGGLGEVGDGLSDLDELEVGASGERVFLRDSFGERFGGWGELALLGNFVGAEIRVVFMLALKLCVQSLVNLVFSTSMFASAKCCIFY